MLGIKRSTVKISIVPCMPLRRYAECECGCGCDWCDMPILNVDDVDDDVDVDVDATEGVRECNASGGC